MDNKINVKQALRVYQAIVSNGEKISADAYVMNGITAASDFDGYTAILRNDYVCLSIFFHSRHAITTTSQKELSLFLEKLEKMDKAAG